ncbi:MAG TPA: hypothetical protein VKB72_15000 [Steroidobacteraceae bacterium]|nr:hypothetical protein [Steroidobacteraceae bacterium]
MQSYSAQRMNPWRACCAGGALLVVLSGCSLISLKTPERPLQPRELNARILTRELSAQFEHAVGRSVDTILESEPDEAVVESALRWQVAAIVSSRGAATQMAPLLSLLDTWALALQMQAFVAEDGAGGALFGTHQAAVRQVVDEYAQGAQTVARRVLTTAEFDDYQRFVAAYARDNPLRNLRFDRPSVIALWSREKGGARLVDSLGTIPEAMEDTAQRLQIYGDTLPVETMRSAQLALRKSGYSHDDLQAALRRLDERLDRLTAVAESAPELVHGAEEEVRQSVREVLARLDAASIAATTALDAQRTALFTELHSERDALMSAVDTQRRALTQDAARIGTQLVRDTGTQVRRLTTEVLLLLTLLALVILGLPFAAGYAVGRSRQRPGRSA